MITGQTVSNTYQGDGSTRDWTISFEFTDSSQVKFKVNGEEVTNNYSLNTVSKVLTYPTVASELDALSSDDTIVIYRDTTITQDIEFLNGGQLNAEMIENGLDKLTMISQEIKSAVQGEESELIIKSDGTDIDSLKTEGMYYIKNPTSTLGLPKLCDVSTSPINARYAVVKVVCPPIEKGTYFVYQEMVIWQQYYDVDSIDQPILFARNLTDYTFALDKKWKKLNNELTIVTPDTTTIDVEEYNGCKVMINGWSLQNYYPATSISSLTITGPASVTYTPNLEIIFKAGSGFSLSSSNIYWLGESPSFTENYIYCIKINGHYGKVERIIVE